MLYNEIRSKIVETYKQKLWMGNGFLIRIIISKKYWNL